MRLLALALAALLLLIQIPLWFGKGGWLRVRDLDRQVEAQRAINAKLGARNAELAAEVSSLREGREAIEERARRDLNMVRDDELLFRLPAAPKPGVAGAAAPAPAPAAAEAAPATPPAPPREAPASPARP
ncbi:MAG TPA: cell division protein FtsB [Burkholderiaceae bacterium]|nr:cell division protein FtsB [Burkholderiaceae bacterium]